VKCVICGTGSHRHACDTCLATIRRRLREIELYHSWLHSPDLIAPTRGTTGRRSAGYGSRPPLRLDVLVLTDRRSRLEPPYVDVDRGIGVDVDDQALPILDTIHTLASHVRAAQGHPAPAMRRVYIEVGYLLGQLDWCASQPGIATFADHVRQLHAQARAVAHDAPPHPLGTCLAVGCGGQVYPPPPRRDTTSCSRCHRSYTGLDLVRLRTQETR
jgi:hypothetical protein